MMFMNELPDWYILSDPGDMSINTQDWYEYAEERLNSLIENNYWLINKPIWMTPAEWQKELAKEYGGHFLLRLAVCKDPRLTSWLVEVEGDLFEFRFINSINFNEKISVLRHLYGKNHIKTLDEIHRTHDIDIYTTFNITESSSRRKRRKNPDLQKHIAVWFDQIPNTIGAKKALLFRGWAIVQLYTIRLEVKRKFESILKETIIKSKELLKNNKQLEATIKPFKEKISRIARETTFKDDILSNDIASGKKIYTKIDCFPPCIRELISILKSKGHLSHAENWQLGTFLKRVGMSIDQQLRFWYENSVDNIGTDFEEFSRKIGYQIKHIYGETGGGTDYDPPKCKTCIEGYYCYFAHRNLKMLTEDIKERFSQKADEEVQQAIEDISLLIINGRYRKACSRYFNLHTRWTNKYPMSHMLRYTETAFKRFYEHPKKEEQKHDNTEKQPKTKEKSEDKDKSSNEDN